MDFGYVLFVSSFKMLMTWYHNGNELLCRRLRENHNANHFQSDSEDQATKLDNSFTVRPKANVLVLGFLWANSQGVLARRTHWSKADQLGLVEWTVEFS